MNATHTEEHDDLLVVEALGVASHEEQRQLDSLISTHGDEYASRLCELRDAAAILALFALPVSPAEETRSRLLASLTANKPLTPKTEFTFDVADKTDDTLDGNAKPANVFSLPTVTTMPGILVMRRSIVTFGAIAASVLIVALAGLAFTMWQRANDTQAQIARVQTEARLDAVRRADETTRLTQELAREREATNTFAAPDARFATLKGTENAPAARANLIFNPRTKRAVLYSHALPPAPQGKAYQIWYIANGKPLPGGVFTTDNQGDGALSDLAPTGSNTASTFAVTLEDAVGALEPKGAKVLTGFSS